MTVGQVAHEATREVAPWVERLARVGYAAIGIVYAVAGGLTAAAGLRTGGTAADKQDALLFVQHLPAGTVILVMMAVGLAGYAAWKIISAVIDSDARGRDAKGIAVRIGSAVSGVMYAAIAAGIATLAKGGSGGSSSDVSIREWTARGLREPFGRTLVAIAGIVLLATAVYQLYQAWKAELGSRLHLDRMDPRKRQMVTNICRFGIAARAVVFGIIGGSLLVAAAHFNAGAAQGTSGAMNTVSHAPYGGALLVVIGLGFVAFGIYALTEARYRTVRAS